MRASSRIGLSACALFLHTACGGDEKAPPIDGPDGGAVVVDAGPGAPDGGPRPDTGPPVMPNDDIQITGLALRLDSLLAGDEVPVPTAAIQALGVAGVMPSSAGVNGDYALTVPQNGTILMRASLAGYLSTYEQVEVAARNVRRDVYLAYERHVELFSMRFGVDFVSTFPCHAPNTGTCRYGIIMGRVVDDGSFANGRPTPIAGVAKDDFTVRGEGDSSWYKKGPYFFFPSGQPNPNAMGTERARDPMTNDYEGGLYVVYVEIPLVGPPSRNFELSVSSLAGGQARRYFGPTQVPVWRGAFTWVSVVESGQAPPPPAMPPPPPPVDVDFDTQIYPLFQTVDQGGLGCQGCHTDQGGAQPAGGLNLYGGAAAAFAGLDPANYPVRVNVQNPSMSLLLTKPLYEVDGNQNHPIFAFVSPQDPAYLLLYGWIQGGGLDAPYAPPVVEECVLDDPPTPETEMTEIEPSTEVKAR